MIPVFVINLAQDTERRDAMRRTLADAGLGAEFVVAVDGRALTPQQRARADPAGAARLYGHGLLDTEIGCYLSHYGLYERMAREGLACALIMEDDVAFGRALPRIVEELVAARMDGRGPDWLVVRLESQRGPVRAPRTRAQRGRPVLALTDGLLTRLSTHVLGLGAYLITQAGARRMLAYGARIALPIDHTMDRFWENGIEPYVVRPIPVAQRAELLSRIGVRPKHGHAAQPARLRLLRRRQRLRDSLAKRIHLLRRASA